MYNRISDPFRSLALVKSGYPEIFWYPGLDANSQVGASSTKVTEGRIRNSSSVSAMHNMPRLFDDVIMHTIFMDWPEMKKGSSAKKYLSGKGCIIYKIYAYKNLS